MQNHPPALAMPSLEMIENTWSQADYEVQLFCPEFTCLCPFTHKPEFAELSISYVPGSYIIETRSFKNYLAAFRNIELLQEFAINHICRDLSVALQPKKLTVKGEFVARGGIRITPVAQYKCSN